MVVVSNTSPIIALSRIQRLDIFEQLFGKIHITPEVLSEALPNAQTDDYKHIQSAVNRFVVVRKVKTDYQFNRKIQDGEKSVLNLALEINADILIMDDRKARNEAKEMNLNAFLAYTTDILKLAEKENIISSYTKIQQQLKEKNIFLPDVD